MNFNYCVHPRCLWLRRGSLGDTKGGRGSRAHPAFGKHHSLWGWFITNKLEVNVKIWILIYAGIIRFNLASDGLQRFAEKRLSLPRYFRNSGRHGMPCISLLLLMFSKFNPDQLGQLSPSEADRWRNTSEKQPKSREALNKSTMFT